jgi:hypothetical protein
MKKGRKVFSVQCSVFSGKRWEKHGAGMKDET